MKAKQDTHDGTVGPHVAYVERVEHMETRHHASLNHIEGSERIADPLPSTESDFTKSSTASSVPKGSHDPAVDVPGIESTTHLPSSPMKQAEGNAPQADADRKQESLPEETAGQSAPAPMTQMESKPRSKADREEPLSEEATQPATSATKKKATGEEPWLEEADSFAFDMCPIQATLRYHPIASKASVSSYTYQARLQL